MSGVRSRPLLTLALVAAFSFGASLAPGQPANPSASPPPLDLTKLSLEDLMRVEVSTVSRKTESWWSAPGAIDVVSDEDIRRSGIMNIPDALRLATGVHVGQASTREWAIAARGFNVNASNKLNVQMDGRSLFTPFFSGVLWDAQDTMIEDISKIEVMRGPGGALWGAYAVNGFIQILTKPAWETQGLLATTAVGTDLPGHVAVRYGAKLTDATFYRVYAKYSVFDWTYTPNTARRAAPKTDFAQAGFRSDTRSAGGNTFTFQGDAYTNKGTPEDRRQNEVSGGNLAAHWGHTFAVDSDLRATAYYDYTSKQFAASFDERRHTVSGSLKYRLTRGRHELQIGSDALVSRDRIRGGIVFLRPGRRTYYSGSLFAQDAIALVPNRWTVTLGAQGLYTNFSDFDFQPTARIAFTPTPTTSLWSALSRAVRTPVRLDLDLTVETGGVLAFDGNENLKPESVLSWELGFRHKFGERFAIATAAFLNDYDNVRSYESATRTFMAFPWTFGNSTNVKSSGVEVNAMAQPLARMFVKASYRYLDFNLTKDPGSGDFRNGFFEANDARHVAAVTTRIDFPGRLEFDTTFRHASSLPNPAVHAYTTADARLGWRASDAWELAVIGRNLLDPRHPEFRTTNSPFNEVGRSVTFKATWRY